MLTWCLKGVSLGSVTKREFTYLTKWQALYQCICNIAERTKNYRKHIDSKCRDLAREEEQIEASYAKVLKGPPKRRKNEKTLRQKLGTQFFKDETGRKNRKDRQANIVEIEKYISSKEEKERTRCMSIFIGT